MKKLLFTTLILAVSFASFSCSDDDDDKAISFEEFATKTPDAKNFLDKHFAPETGIFDETQVRSVELEDDGSYEVLFNNGIEIDFYATGEWRKIDMNGKDLPQSVATLIHVKAIEYINSRYPNDRIEEIEKKVNERLEIEIKPSDIDLLFDLNGNVQSDPGIGESSKPQTGLNPTDLPLSAQEFINKHFADAALIEAKKDKDEYEVDLTGFDLDFDLNGDFKSVEAEGANSIPESIFNDPSVAKNGKAILTYIKDKHSNMKIKELSKLPSYFTGVYENGYKVELVGTLDLDIIFDKDCKHIATYKD